jgi:predicted Zn-dependent protease with MMP-like domain
MRRRIAAFLGRGDRGTTAIIAFSVLILLGFQRAAIHYSYGTPGPSPWLAALVAAVVVGGAWLISAKLAADASAVHAANQEAERLDRAADAQFTARSVGFACSEDEFAALAEAELDSLPEWIRQSVHANNVAIAVEDERAGEPRVLGIYRRGAGSSEIVLYRLTIMRVAVDRRHLRAVIHDTLLHELGHLFGMSEHDLDHFSIGNHPLPDAQPVHPPHR